MVDLSQPTRAASCATVRPRPSRSSRTRSSCGPWGRLPPNWMLLNASALGRPSIALARQRAHGHAERLCQPADGRVEWLPYADLQAAHGLSAHAGGGAQAALRQARAQAQLAQAHEPDG